MKVKRQYIIFMLCLLFMILGTTISYGSYQSENKTVESGKNVSITVTSTDALDAYNLDLKDAGGLTFNSCSKTESGAIISINGSSIGYINASGKTTNLGTYNFTVPSVTENKTYTVTFQVDKKTTVTANVTVTAPVVEKTPEPDTTTNNNTQTETPATNNNTPTETKKSSEARLSNLGIKPNDFSGFSKNINQEKWSTTVPNDVAEVEVYATTKDSKAKVEGTGKVALNEGNNTVKVKVTAEDGTTTKTYTLTINRKTSAEQAKEDGEARLKNLGIKPKEYDFTGFDSEKTEYSVEVPNEVEEIEVYATAMNSNAQITGTGMITLEEGLNELKIESIAADGTKKTYMLNVTRKEAEEVAGTTEEIFGLSTLSIQGLKLSPSFKSNIYEYTTELTSVIVGNSLNINAKANDEDATVEIIGNENLQEGENIITILVKNEETEESATYQITVNKSISVEEVEQQMSWLKPETWGKEEYIKIAIIAVIIILIIIAIVLKINISKGSMKDLPGADELDKAIAEHQELSEGKNYGEEIIENNSEINYAPQNEAEQNYIEEIAVSRFGIEEDSEAKPKRRGRHF